MSKLKGLYVVREHFKAGGKLYLAGTVLPEEALSEIPLLKIRIGERKVVALENLDQDGITTLGDWIKVRYDVDLKSNIRAYLTAKAAEDKATQTSTPTPGTKAPTKTKTAR